MNRFLIAAAIAAMLIAPVKGHAKDWWVLHYGEGKCISPKDAIARLGQQVSSPDAFDKFLRKHGVIADIDVKKDDKGNVENWGAELLPNPAQLINNGWSRKRSADALKPGTRVIVTIAPSKAGTHVGLLIKMTNEAGEELLAGGAGTPNPLQTAPQR